MSCCTASADAFALVRGFADNDEVRPKPAIEVDEALRSLPITGVFDAYDAESFVATLATLKDVVVQKTPTRIRVFKRATTPREPLPNGR